MSFPFALRSLKSTPSLPALVVEPEVSLTSFEDLYKLQLSHLSLPAALASLARHLQTNPSLTFSSFVSLITNLNLSSILLSNQKQDAVLEVPSHPFPLANFADEVAFERKEEEHQRAQRTLDVNAAVLQTFSPLLALHLALGLPDALFAKKQQLVEEALEELVRLMTDGSTGEKLKGAGRLPESMRMALRLEGKVVDGMAGWELVELVARRLKERLDPAQPSSSSWFNSLGNGSSSSPLSNQPTRILILTSYLTARISSPSSFKLTETSLNSFAQCFALVDLDASLPPVSSSSSFFFTSNGSTFVAHLLVKATKILHLHGRIEREVSRKGEKRIAASTVARLAIEQGDRDFNERMKRIESRSSRAVSSKSSGSPLSTSVDSLFSSNSTSSSSFGTPSLVTPPSTPRSLVNLPKDSSSTESLALELESGSLVRGGKDVAWRGRMGREEDASRLMNGWLKW